MSSITATPSTLDGIKRLAKAIKRAQGITHHEALDLAARQARYENFRHAQAQFIQGVASTFPVYLSAYWSRRGGQGRETLTLRLPKPLAEIVSARQVDSARNLGGFKMEALDHLECISDRDSQEDAHIELFKAARTLAFMAATGLRPATTKKERRMMDRASDVPGRDHPSYWVDRATGAWVYLDEPYEKPSIAGRDAWAAHNNLFVRRPSWPGIYNPGSSIPFLFSLDEAVVVAVACGVESLRQEASNPDWHGDSASYYTHFVSPARQASGRPRRARSMPAYRGVERNGALPYGASRGGQKSLWRPAKRMPLELHLKVGPILAALATGLDGVGGRSVGHVRSTLDDWIQMEYPTDAEMTGDQFRAAYYGDHREPIFGAEAQEEAIARAIDIIRLGYADCSPRNEVIRRLSTVQANLKV